MTIKNQTETTFNTIRRNVLSLSMLTLLVLPVSTFAADSVEEAAADLTGHCVTAVLDSEVQNRSADSMVECFDDFTAAIAHATDGAVWLPASDDFDRQLGLLEEALAGRSQEEFSTFVIAVDYKRGDYKGGTLTWTSGSACTSGGGTKYANTMPDGWNNKVSSTKGYSNCGDNVLFDFTNRSNSGSKITCTSNCADLGAMNNDASSREWSY